MGTTIASKALLICVALITLQSAHAQTANDVKGAGATFPAAVYTSWAFSYTKEKQTRVGYQPTGSGEGVRLISSREVDFGATDTPLPNEEASRLNLIQFPTLIGGIVPVVNVRGIAPGKLRLTGAVLADIYAGRITTWNDGRIAAINPGVDLPNTTITRIVRADSSGSTETFTHYLASASATWQKQVGVGKTVRWPGEVVNASGTDGVVRALQATSGGIAYISFDRVVRMKLAYALLQNRSGQFVAPSEYAFRATVKASDMFRKGEESASLIDLPGVDTWPITDATYILVDSKPKNSSRASQVLSFFYWAFLKGDEIVNGTGFAPLPSELQARIVRRLAEVKPADGKAIELLRAPYPMPALAALD